MRFENPEYLIFLGIIPLLFLLRFALLRLQRSKMRAWGDSDMMHQQSPDVSRYRPLIKFSLVMTILALLIIMFARPQMGTKVSNEKREGIEAIFCLDVSNSMLSTDVSPSRLEKSKLLVQNLVEHFTNDKIGLVVFAGDAFTQLPITKDYISAKMFLQNANPALIEEQGTDIGKAIEIAQQSFTKQEHIGKAIVVITDGENHEQGTLEAAKAAADAGLRVFVLGVGSDRGGRIQLSDGSFMTDASGNEVITKLNEDMCRELAKAGKGVYIHVDNTSDAQKKLDDALTGMQRSEISSVVYSEYGEQFQIVGVIVIILIIIELFVMERKSKLQRRLKLFSKQGSMLNSKKSDGLAHLIILLLLMAWIMPSGASAQNSDRDYIRRGNRLYRSKNYVKAAGEYQKAIGKNKENGIAYYNLGCANMAMADATSQLGEKLQNDSLAIRNFEMSAKVSANDKGRRASAYHNIGTTFQKHYYYFDEISKNPDKYKGVDDQMIKEAQQQRHNALINAIKAYRSALRSNPKDDDTRYNLALCQYLLSKEPKNNGGGGQSNNKDDKKDQQDKQKQQNQQQQQEQQQQQNNQMSQQNAEQMLNAADRKEQAVQQRMQRAKPQEGRRPSRSKNW